MVKDGQTRRGALNSLVGAIAAPYVTATELTHDQIAGPAQPQNVFVATTVVAATALAEARTAEGAFFKAVGSAEGLAEVRRRTDSGSDILYDEITGAGLRSSHGAKVVGLEQGGTLQDAVNVLTPEMFGAAAMVDHTAAIQAVVDEAVDGTTIEFKRGFEYKVTSVNLGNKQVILSGYGAKIVQTAKQRAFHWMGAWGDIHHVDAITTDTVSIAGSNYKVAVLNLASAPSDLSAGDIIKVYSEDPIPESVFARRRLGEFATVYKVNGTKVHINGGLRENYQTDIRVTRMDRKRPIIEGLTFGIDPSIDTTPGSGSGRDAPIYICWGWNPIVRDVVLERTVSNGVVMVSCFGYSVEGLSAHNLPDQSDSEDARYGYAVVDANCNFGRVSGGLFVNVRHGFTTNTYGSRFTDPWAYGRTAHPTISDSTAIGGAAAGFDTHDECFGATFVNCHHIEGVDRVEATPHARRCGFQIRGEAAMLLGCTTNGLGIDIATAPERSGGDVPLNWIKKATLIACRIANPPATALRIARAKVTMQNCDLEGDGNSNSAFMVSVGDGELNVIGGRFVFRDPSASSAVFALFGNIDKAKLTVTGGTQFDLSWLHKDSSDKLVNYSQRLASSATTGGNIISIRDVIVEAGSKPIADIVSSYSAGDTTALADVANVKITATNDDILCADGNIRKPGLFALAGNFGADQAAVSNVIQMIDGSVRCRSRTKYVSGSGSGNVSNLTRHIADDYMLDYSPSSGTTTLSNIVDGYVDGQRLTIRHRGTTNTLRIPHGENIALVGEADKDLLPGELLVLMWAGTVWVG